jgi:hypothetical protein
MPDARARHEGIREELAAAVKEKPRPVRGFLCLFVHRRALNRRQATALVSWPSISPILIADSVTPTVSRQKDGKLRIVYAGWDNAKVVEPTRSWSFGPARGGSYPSPKDPPEN